MRSIFSLSSCRVFYVFTKHCRSLSRAIVNDDGVPESFE
ncbi:hypothetical protein CFter6_2784 [Collimonas fungivorans]|uniref:Uncharacterized protein n=1 Tax=Collimonas fungivorans TaxID=158899 RepID=A0A127PCC2_9BURK|nr:hypothetical protein CFter6_2784 [Collimonas fungivorans]